MFQPLFRIAALSLLAINSASVAWSADDYQIVRFRHQQLTTTYYSEGAGAGDLNNDSVMDVVYGPFWFEGPGYTQKHEIYAPKPQNMEGYADNFFAWVRDFDGDGWNDVFVVGFPGTPAYVYKNPGKPNPGQHWEKIQVADWVSNESPQVVNLVGDETPELVCTRDGFFGYYTIGTKGIATWTFHPISEKVADGKFGHGLGIGDINGDGRQDVLHTGGWFEQPKDLASGGGRWIAHTTKFSNAYGGAEMYAYDVDGDGDADVIASMAAHDFGLAWYEQKKDGDEIQFVRHEIMGSRPEQNRYGLNFSELHSVNLIDVDGDGLKDILTGKTYYSHHKKSPQWDAGAVVYWFKLVRNKDGVDWVPYRAADDCGIGRQLGVFDLNKDNLQDIVVGGMKGCSVLVQSREKVDKATWQAAQPKIYEAPPKVSKNVDGSIFEGEELAVASVSGGAAKPQGMAGFSADRWSGDSQLWWAGAKPGDKLTLTIPVKEKGTFPLLAAFTKARDYGIAQLWLDDMKLGNPIDFFHTPDVISTGLVDLGTHELSAGDHRFTIEITGTNPAAVKGYMVGIDAIQLGKSLGELPKDSDGKALNLDFELGNLTHWTAEGDAFNKQPIEGDTVVARRKDMHSGHQGKYWIGTFERNGDKGVGTLTSDSFKLSQPFASFLVGGGDTGDTRVEIVDKSTGRVLFRASGRDTEDMRLVIVDMKSHVGKEVFVRLIDNSRNGWGHINFDDFRLHAQKPGPVSQPDSGLTADQYPHKGIAADLAAAAMTLPEGFRVIAAASEPDVKQPIAMALDDRGRLWIAEAYEYPVRAKGEKGRDRILIFEDKDGDGKLESKKLFTEGLNLVSGLEVGFGGVWVGAAPYLMFIPDANGDDVPDGEPKILLDGWGHQDTHETLNAFIWGPDGWLYGCHGVFTHSRVGKPGTPDSQRQPINAGIWRYHPTRHVFEVFAHGTSNPWGVDFNDRGQAFLTSCVIPHLYHIIQGARYERQAGQHFNSYTYDDIKTVADHRHYLGATPHSGNGKSDSAGGGHAHAGAMIYLGGAWPEKYRDQIFMNNIHGQRLNMDILKAKGSGYVGSHGPDFLLTGDQASQILNLRYGPDGQAFMIDWYDMQACHTGDATRHDRSNGRIYKIVYGKSNSVTVDLSKKSDLELAQLMLEKNDWYVRHGRRVLQERAAKGKLDPSAVAELKNLAFNNPDPTRRLRGLWALAATNLVDQATATRMLKDQDEYVRSWTIQIISDNMDAKPWLATLTEMAKEDPSPVVRLYLATAAGKLAVETRWDLLSALIAHGDRDDHNLPYLLWYASEPLAVVDARRALALSQTPEKTSTKNPNGQSVLAHPKLREFMLRRIGAIGTPDSLALLVDSLNAAQNIEDQVVYLQSIRNALAGQRRANAPASWSSVAAKLIQSNDSRVKLLAQSLGVTFGDELALQQVRELVTGKSGSPEQRREAVTTLLAARDPKLPTILHALLDDEKLRDAAMSGLAQYSDSKTAELILERYAKLPQNEKRTALATLSARPEYAVAMLQSIAAKKISSKDLSADLVRQLQNLKDDRVTKLLGETWGTVRETAADKAKLIEETKQLVAARSKPKPNLSLGRAVYARTCQQCHTLFGTGGNVGPELTGSNRTNLDYLLSNIVDPSAVMAKEYQPTIIQTSDGRVVTGIVKSEDAKALTLQTATASEVIPIDEIENRKLSPLSMMPDDQLRQFSPAEIVALLAYLASPSQVPLLADEKNASLLFNGKDLTGWNGNKQLWKVENGEIVGLSTGLKHNEFLVSDMSADNFRLKLQVKLVKNLGNSGVQFRSVKTDEGMKGYQADIGSGWWGKLYEEEGRALLWPKSGEEHVKQGEWNDYEIIAVGPKIQTFINGKLCADLEDLSGARQGVFGLQLHSGGPTEVRYRNFQLEVLPEK